MSVSIIYVYLFPVCANGIHNKEQAEQLCWEGNRLIPLWCLKHAHHTLKRWNQTFSSLADSVSLHKAMLHGIHSYDWLCIWVVIPPLRYVWLELLSSSLNNAWEDNQSRFSCFYSRCDVCDRQRLFWLEAFWNVELWRASSRCLSQTACPVSCKW